MILYALLPITKVTTHIISCWLVGGIDTCVCNVYGYGTCEGIMNGMDAVAVATGQDWRALEAGAHAYASHHRNHARYASLTHYAIVGTGNGEPHMIQATYARMARLRSCLVWSHVSCYHYHSTLLIYLLYGCSI